LDVAKPAFGLAQHFDAVMGIVLASVEALASNASRS
jgi:hypothetical protein